MFTVIGLFFITLLSMVLFMLYNKERLTIKNNRHHALVEEYWAGKDRRKHNRFKKTIEVIYTVSKKPHLKSSGRTVDISLGGMGLLLDEKHSVGAIMELKISAYSSGPEIEVEGKIVWCKESAKETAGGKRMFQYGIEFLSIKEPSGKHLGDYINSIST